MSAAVRVIRIGFAAISRGRAPIILAAIAIILVWLLFLVFVALRVPSPAPVSSLNPLGWFSVPAEIAYKQPVNETAVAEKRVAVKNEPLIDVAAVYEWRGQVGDSFGILTSLFTALSFFAVWWSLRLATKSADEAQFFRELDRAIDSYNNHLLQLRVIDADKTNDNSGRNGLNRLWEYHLLFRLKPLASGNSRLPFDATESAKIALNTPSTLATLPPDEIRSLCEIERNNDEEWVVFKTPLSDEDLQNLRDIQMIVRKVYHDFEHQLDALFRCWYHVFKLIDEAERIPSHVRIGAAKRFRAQLSWVELSWLLANQSQLDGKQPLNVPLKLTFPNAARLSVLYSVFDNLSLRGDPVVTLLHKFWHMPQEEISKYVSGEHLTPRAFKSK